MLGARAGRSWGTAASSAADVTDLEPGFIEMQAGPEATAFTPPTRQA